MRKFIIKLILVISPFIIIALTMEYILRQIPNDYMYKSDYLDEHSNEVEVLILGGSHSYYGINPDYLTAKAFNAGYVSQPLNIDLMILEKYQDNFENLKTIIIPVSYPSLWTKLDKSAESWRIKNYVMYYKLKYVFSLQSHTEIVGNNFNTNVRRLKNHYIGGRSYITCNKSGWGADYNSKFALDLDKTGKEAASRHSTENFSMPKSERESNYKDNISILNNITNWALERNVEVILITTPGYKIYRENLNEVQLAAIMEISAQLSEKYSNCRYINLLNESSFGAEDYYDADHLNEKGAEKLSLLINDILQNEKGLDY